VSAAAVGAVSAPETAAAIDALVRVENLSVAFDGTTVVSGIGFTLEPGRCVALVGESGSGKSVTARSLLGLAGRGSTVTADRLTVGAHDLLRLDEREWRGLRGREVGLVLQDALVSLDPLVNIRGQLNEPLRLHTELNRPERLSRSAELLSEVGIADAALRLRQYPHQLSGGLRQRALIASAVAANPRVLIADEPTTALDVTVQKQVLALLARLKAQGTGLLLVSHDLAVVSSLADEILVLRGGELVERGDPDAVLRDPQASYTKELIAAIPSGSSRGTRLSKLPPFSFADRRVPAAQPLAPGSADPAPPVIEARALNKVYPRPGGGGTQVLFDVSFDVRRGTTLGLVGESGSGKSTAAGIVLGLTEPSSGEVRLDGEPWSSVPERKRRMRRRRIQTISQDPLGSFDPRDSVRAILTEALGAAGVPAEDRLDRAVQLLEQVGLRGEHLGRHPLELSGGQRQRVSISRALATDPEVIVCDEPVSALDVSIQAQVLDLLTDLQDQLGVSLLFISHDLGVIRHIAHDVAVMQHGRIVETGEPEQIFEQPEHPYTRELISAIPRL